MMDYINRKIQGKIAKQGGFEDVDDLLDLF